MGLAVVTVASGGLPVVESTAGGTPVTEAANGRGVPVTKVVGKPGLPVVFETIGVATPFAGASFDGVKSADITLTNGNLTATVNSTAGFNIGARSLAAKTTGKYYFEFIAGQMNNVCMCGVLSSAASYTNMNAGTNTTLVLRGGTIVSNNAGAQGTAIPAVNLNDVVCFALDLNARKVWVRKNAGAWAGSGAGPDPATGVSGINVTAAIDFAPAVCWGGGGQVIGDAWTGNFGSTAFAQAVPAGFTSGWPA